MADTAVNGAAEAVRLLLQKRLRVSFAESCTGGLLSGALVSVPGASGVYDMGFVTYSNASKAKLLGVSEQTLRENGAVSPECACEMALGALRASGADIAVSVTGIAGPDGGTPEKPVGLVYIALASKSGARAYKNNFTGSRAEIRAQSVCRAIDLLVEALIVM